MDKEFQVVPLGLEVLAVGLEDGLQAVRHLLGDIRRNLLHVGIALQVAAAHVQRNVGRVDHAVEQGEEVGHDVLHLVRHEHLVAVELDLVAVDVNVVLDAREIKHTREVERIVHVEVDPEKGFVGHGVELAVELLVVLVLERGRRFGPQGCGVVHHVVLLRVHLLAVLPLGLLAEHDFHGQEAAVFVEQFADFALLQELLAVVGDVQHDVGAAFGFLASVDFKCGRAVAGPFHGFGIFSVAAGDDIHAVGHHEGGIKSQAKMSDNGRSVFLVFLQEVVGTGKGYLVDVLVNFLGGHTDTVIAHGQCFCLRVNADTHLEFAHLALEVALHGQGLELLGGIDGVADNLAEKNLMVAVKKLLDDRENVLCGNSDISFLHFYVGLMVIFIPPPIIAKDVPQCLSKPEIFHFRAPP